MPTYSSTTALARAELPFRESSDNINSSFLIKTLTRVNKPSRSPCHCPLRGSNSKAIIFAFHAPVAK